MGNLFKLDSPFTRFMTMVANLVCLNVLWLLCCIPIVTAGAATTAMYHVIFQYLTRQDDAVVKPFFRSLRENFAGATVVWVIHLVIIAVVAVEGLYIIQWGTLPLLVVYGIQVLLLIGVSSYLYPLLARYDASPKRTVLNSFLMALRHLVSTVSLVVLNAMPAVLLLLLPGYLPIQLLVGFALIAYLNGRVLLSVFKKYEPQEETDE